MYQFLPNLLTHQKASIKIKILQKKKHVKKEQNWYEEDQNIQKIHVHSSHLSTLIHMHLPIKIQTANKKRKVKQER